MGMLEERLKSRERENLINPGDLDAEIVGKVLASGLMKGEYVVSGAPTSGYYWSIDKVYSSDLRG